MRNRDKSPNAISEGQAEDGTPRRALLWYLEEGECLMPVEGQEDLFVDEDDKPVTEPIKGPLTVTVMATGVMGQEDRAGQFKVIGRKPLCDCNACMTEIKTHGRRLLAPERDLVEFLPALVPSVIKAMKITPEAFAVKSTDARVVKTQFCCWLASYLLPWNEGCAPEVQHKFREWYSQEEIDRAFGIPNGDADGEGWDEAHLNQVEQINGEVVAFHNALAKGECEGDCCNQAVLVEGVAKVFMDVSVMKSPKPLDPNALDGMSDLEFNNAMDEVIRGVMEDENKILDTEDRWEDLSDDEFNRRMNEIMDAADESEPNPDLN